MLPKVEEKEEGERVVFPAGWVVEVVRIGGVSMGLDDRGGGHDGGASVQSAVPQGDDATARFEHHRFAN